MALLSVCRCLKIFVRDFSEAFLNYCYHAVCLIGFFSDVCFECQFVVKPDTQVFFKVHFFNVFAIDFFKILSISNFLVPIVM